MFGLASVVTGHGPLALSVFAKVPGSFGRVFVDCKVAQRVDRIAFLSRLDDEFLGEFSVRESRQAQHARRVGRRQIAAKFICEVVKKRLRLVLTEPTDFPDYLVLARRGIEDKVRCWNFG